MKITETQLQNLIILLTDIQGIKGLSMSPKGMNILLNNIVNQQSQELKDVE